MLRMLIHGVGGRMGRVLLDVARESPDLAVAAGVDKAPSGGQGFPVFERLDEVDVPCDVLIDFSRPDALDGILRFAVERGVPAVFATTGYSEADLGRMERAAARVPIFRSANMSLGVNLMIDLVQKGASFLGEGCDVEIVEAHHRTKADAPSGTALMLADAINKVYEDTREYVYGRHARSHPRAQREIGIHSLRGGTMVGDHTVSFFMNEERVEVHHSAQSRRIFAVGALQAARFLVSQPPKLYDMRDLLLARSSVTHLRAERDVAMVTLCGLPEAPQSMARVLSCMADAGIVVDMIGQTRQKNGALNFSFSLDSADCRAACDALARLFGPGQVLAETPLVKLTVVGLGMERQAGVAARVFELTAGLDILPHMVTTSPTEISLLIDPCDEFPVASAIGKAFGV